MFNLFDEGPARNGATESEVRRDEALALLRAHRAALIRELQSAALHIACERGEVCADDVRALVPIPPDVSPKVVGAAFRELAAAGILSHTGTYRRSCRPVAHARPLPLWQLADAAGASAWLSAHHTV